MCVYVSLKHFFQVCFETFSERQSGNVYIVFPFLCSFLLVMGF